MLHEGELKSLEFDLDDFRTNEKVDSSKMNSLLSKVQKGLVSDTRNDVDSPKIELGPRSQFGIGEKDLDPLAAAPGMIPP